MSQVSKNTWSMLAEDCTGTKEFALDAYLLKERKIFIFGEISSNALLLFSMQLHTLVAQDPKSTIKIYLNSPGGCISDGLAICDLISEYKDIIEIYCMGTAYSMGGIILSCGKKGNRYIYPHSKVMLHEPLITNLSNKSASSIKETADSILETKDILIDLLTKNTGNPRETVEKAISFDNFMNAKEAIDFHIVDQIVDIE